MTFPGVGRAVLIGGSLGGGTGRTTDWSTYNGNNDTDWQQWVDDSSTALGTTYQSIKGYKNTANELASIGGAFIGVDNNGTQTVAKFVPDTDDATSGQFTLGSFHNLGTNKVQMVNNGAEIILTSNADQGTIVVFDQQLNNSGKISALATSLPNDNWDCTVFETTTSSGGSSSPSGTYNYSEHYWHSGADMIVWYMGDGDEYKGAAHLWLKGNYSARYGTDNANNSGGSGFAGLITSPSTQPYYGNAHRDSINRFGDTYRNDGAMGSKDNIIPHIHRMRKHLEPDQNHTDFSGLFSQRQTERMFISLNIFDDDGTTSDNLFKMDLINHYASNGGGGFGGDGVGFSLHSESSYRSNSDVKYYTPTGRSSNNTKPENNVSMVKDSSLIKVYGDETGTNGGTLFVTAISDTTETASSSMSGTAHDDGGVAEMFRFDEVTANNTHSTNAKIVSSTTTSDSSNTGFDAEDVCIGDLHENNFGIAWRQGSTAYISIFTLAEQTSDMPVLTRVADSINLGTVPNAGRMALSKLGNGVAVLTCGNYYRIIKTNAV